jgi:hypothetical protein
MTTEELRKHLIFCENMEEMKQVFNKLKAIGEPIARSVCNYREAKSLRYNERINAWADCWAASFPRLSFLRCEDFLDLKVKANTQTGVDINELRKHVIECRTLEEMRTVWKTLKGLGEHMFRSVFSYAYARNLATDTEWGATSHSPTLSYSTFMTEFGHKQDIDRDFLRKQVVGGFNSLDEMKEAWEMLRSIGEPTVRTAFQYATTHHLKFLTGGPFGWGIVAKRATMSLQELKTFISSPSVPIEEVAKSDEATCNCRSLIHGHSLGCHYFKER